MTCLARLCCAAIAAVLLAGGCQSTPDPDLPSIRVFDQEPFHGTVVVQEAVSAAPGWIVIRGRLNGQPGPAVGAAPVKAGANRWVRIAVAAEPPAVLYAALHADSDSAPADAVTVGGAPVIALFRLRERSRFLSPPDR